MYGVSKISCVDDVMLISMAEANAAHMAKTLQELAQAGVVVDMISQNASSGGSIHFSFTAPSSYLNDALKAICSETKTTDQKPMVSGGYAKICLFGEEMENEAGVAARALQELVDAKIDIYLVTTSDFDISLLIRQEDVDVAMDVLKRSFSL